MSHNDAKSFTLYFRFTLIKWRTGSAIWPKIKTFVCCDRTSRSIWWKIQQKGSWPIPRTIFVSIVIKCFGKSWRKERIKSCWEQHRHCTTQLDQRCRRASQGWVRQIRRNRFWSRFLDKSPLYDKWVIMTHKNFLDLGLHWTSQVPGQGSKGSSTCCSGCHGASVVNGVDTKGSVTD